jgi:hypothetical protein
MASQAVDWIVHTQRGNGGWGWHVPTAEETAYALQALIMWAQDGGGIVHADVLRRGYHWLCGSGNPCIRLLFLSRPRF